MTVFDRAVIEHNLLALSQLYSTMTLESLARKLLVSTERAEQTITKMLQEKRLENVVIDQVDGLVSFEECNTDDLTEPFTLV